MKIVSIVGARPQFIKAAVVSRVLRERHDDVLVHTGQHYDDAMSDVFFRELDIPPPRYQLGIGSGSHGVQTGRMLIEIDAVLRAVRPDWVLVYGDTNSTLSGALAAERLGLPVAHVEAGMRSFNASMPEEQNRVLTDHCSRLLLCSTADAAQHLRREGLERGIHVVGDVMYDALLTFRDRARQQSTILADMALQPGGFLLATVHRAANTDDPAKLAAIVEALVQLDETVLWPIHPRTRHCLKPPMMARLRASNVRVIDPLPYFDMLVLMEDARVVLTDSGGMQKEAFWLRTPCITLRDETEWTGTIACGWNRLVGADTQAILAGVASMTTPIDHPELYGDGQAAAKCVRLLEAS